MALLRLAIFIFVIVIIITGMSSKERFTDPQNPLKYSQTGLNQDYTSYLPGLSSSLPNSKILFK